MEFEVLYSIDVGMLQWQVFLIPIGFIIVGLYSIKLINRYGFVHPMQSLGFFPMINFSVIGKFFAFIFAFFGFVFLVIMVVQVPKRLSWKMEIEKLIEHKDLKVVEGRVEDLSMSYDENKRLVSIDISGVNLVFLDRDEFGPKKETTDRGILIKEGRYLRISYFLFEGKNTISKIQLVKTEVTKESKN